MEQLPRRAGLRGENGANEHGGVTFREECDFDGWPSTASLLTPPGDWVSVRAPILSRVMEKEKKRRRENGLLFCSRTRIAALERRSTEKKTRMSIGSSACGSSPYPHTWQPLRARQAHLITRPLRRLSPRDMTSNRIALSDGNWPFVMSQRALPSLSASLTPFLQLGVTSARCCGVFFVCFFWPLPNICWGQ